MFFEILYVGRGEEKKFVLNYYYHFYVRMLFQSDLYIIFEDGIFFNLVDNLDLSK